MNNSYDFIPDTSTCYQIDDTRFFEIQADKESVERFIKDLELFEKKSAEEGE
jgi:hypothetical protein